MQFETYLLFVFLLFLLIIIIVYDAMLANYKSQVLYTSSSDPVLGGGGAITGSGKIHNSVGNAVPTLGTNGGITPSFTLERGEQTVRMMGQFILDVSWDTAGGTQTVGQGGVIRLGVVQEDNNPTLANPNGPFKILTEPTNYPISQNELTTIRIPFVTEKADWNRPQTILLNDGTNQNILPDILVDGVAGNNVNVYKASYWYY